MKKNKLYFSNDNNEACYELEVHIDRAKDEDVSELELYEAVERKDIKNEFWCMELEKKVDRCDCKKSECVSYNPINGKNGICSFRGRLYSKGEKLKIEIK